MINMVTRGLVETQKYYNRHGLELSNPYLDHRIAEFVANVPAHLLGRPGGNRWLLRSAAAKRLPQAVVNRTDKTRFTALMDRGIREEDACIRQLMQNPLVVEQGYVRADWVATQFGEGMNWRRSSFSGVAWLCICLELWLRKVSGMDMLQRATF